MSEPIAIPPPSNDALEARAADFLQRKRFWDWGEQDQAELDAWLAESLAHRVAYLRLEAGASSIERLVALRPPRLPLRVTEARSSPRIPRTFLATAASLVLSLVGVVAWRYLDQPADRTFATEVGGRATLKFADGTVMELNTDTAVRYRITTGERIVWLDHGEAYFTVAHDAARPFTVNVAGRQITDLGTEFLVHDESDNLELALLKGRAQLSASGSNTRATVLSPGEVAMATPASLTVSKKTPQQLSDELAWKRGVLVFRNTTLAEAAREFNRYNTTKLVVSDPEVARLKIGGEFKINNVDDFLRLAQAVLGVSVDRSGSEIRIAREKSASKPAGSRSRP